MTGRSMTSVEVRPRAPGISYQQLLDTDSHEVPEILRREQPFDDGPMFVPVERYISPEFFQLERTKVWDRTWQMACREEHLPNVGDYIVYDVAGRSYLVVRSGPSTIQAFHNVCLHRGRLLRTEGGCRATEFRCPFHGFGWKIDGSLLNIPCAWDFPQVDDPADWSLRDVQVAHVGRVRVHQPRPRRRRRWQSYVGELGDHFARWPLEDRFVQVHVAKILRCNWKVAQEAFMEAMHVVATHPQILAEHRRRQLAVRRVRQLQPGDHRQRHAEPAPQVGSRPSRRCSTRCTTATSTSRRCSPFPRGAPLARSPPTAAATSCGRCSAPTPTRCRTPRSTTASTSRCSPTSTRGARSTASSTASGPTA